MASLHEPSLILVRSLLFHILLWLSQIKGIKSGAPRKVVLKYKYIDTARPETLRVADLVMFTKHRLYLYDAIVTALLEAVKERALKGVPNGSMQVSTI